MNDIGDIVKMLARETVEETKPVSVVTGEVIEDDELVVETEQKLQLTRSFLIIGKLFEQKIWNKGDRLLLLRCDGGQKYVVLDILHEEKGEEEK